MENVSLKQLIERTYDVKEFSLAGPAWLDSERFDVAAKPASDAPKPWVRPMLQSLLADRFGLVAHRETKSLSGYALIVWKRAPALHEKPAGAGSNTSSGRGRLIGTNVSMAELADLLSRKLDQPVQDLTGLKGAVDFKLEWPLDDTQGEASSMLTALQEQLGLKMQSQKVMVEMLVVDHVEKTPTEN